MEDNDICVTNMLIPNVSKDYNFKVYSWITETSEWIEPADIKTPKSISRTGYVFKGWNTNSSGTGTYYDADTSYEFSENLTLYAGWEPITYGIHFDGNGATGGSMEGVAYSYDEEKALDPFNFIKQYTIKYDGNGGTSTSS